MRRIAVVGSGISGLSVAHALAGKAKVSLFEAGDYFGGHTHTVEVEVDTPGGHVRHGVDTGFLVFNERTYPLLIRLFAELGVATAGCDMSFSVNVARAGLEWSGSSLRSVFAQPRNLTRPAFLGMLAQVLRFNRLCTAIAGRDDDAALRESIGEFLDTHRFTQAFRDWYFLPMIGSIWSCPTRQMMQFPVATMIRFCHNHGLLQVAGRPRWFSVVGGAKHYVDKMLARIPDARLNTPVRRVWREPCGARGPGVTVATDAGTETFDDVVLACHSDQSLALLGDGATRAERDVLGAIRYHRNHAVLHTDARLLPQRKAAWAAWNYESGAVPSAEGESPSAVCLHYLINKLQPLPFDTPVLVSLNPVREPRAGLVQGAYDYAHPVFDAAAIDAQRRLPGIQGHGGLWFCGAWTRYGFHEDGLMSGLAVANRLLEPRQAKTEPTAPVAHEAAA